MHGLSAKIITKKMVIRYIGMYSQTILSFGVYHNVYLVYSACISNLYYIDNVHFL